jgi:hypothetical protein
MIAIHLRRRSHEDTLAESGAVIEDRLGPLDISDESLDRTLDDEPHSDGSGEAVDDVPFVHAR